MPNSKVLPMIKANAYGVGAIPVARALCQEPVLHGFGVATLLEGAQLREGLGAAFEHLPLIAFYATPWSEEKSQWSRRYGMTLVLANLEDLKAWLSAGAKDSVHLQWNTGLTRLGLEMSDLSQVRKLLSSLPKERRPTGIMTHLASPDQQDASHCEIEKFKHVQKELKEMLPGALFHAASSGGLWNSKLDLQEVSDIIRPGISLYGIPPVPHGKPLGTQMALRFCAQVLHVHEMLTGVSIGYGGTYRNESVDSKFAAILGAGYADGVVRSLSNHGIASLESQRSRFLGRVSMDSCAVECAPDTLVGSWAEIFGETITPWEQAELAKTIPWELLTSISMRVPRIYHEF